MTSSLPDAVPLLEVKRALITKLRHYGDVLLASPVFSTLKRIGPHIEIDALVYSDTAPMLENHPAITRLFTIDRDWKRQDAVRHFASEWTLLRALRGRHYDLFVHLTEHPRGLTFARLLQPRYAVTRERNGDGLLWRRRFTHFYKTPAKTPRHTVETNLDALRRIGVYPSAADKRLVLVPGADAEAKIDALLVRHGLTRDRFVQAHPGSRWLFKCAPVERMAALLDQIVADGLRVALTGAPDVREQAIIAQITAACAPSTRNDLIDFSGALTLQELAALTARARAFIGVDSAPMHIAAAVQTPTLAFFGPSDEATWGPWQVPHRIVASTVHPCRPCNLDGCGGGKVSECLTTLAADGVHAKFLSLLRDAAGDST